MNRHYSDHELILLLYDATGADSHMAACAECQKRWLDIQERRARVPSEADPRATDVLMRQRRMILDRIRKDAPPSRLRSAWIPTLMAAMLVAGLLGTLPASRRAKPASAGLVGGAGTKAKVVPENWFEDAYSATQPVEPRAASAIRGLFAEGPAEQ